VMAAGRDRLPGSRASSFRLAAGRVEDSPWPGADSFRRVIGNTFLLEGNGRQGNPRGDLARIFPRRWKVIIANSMRFKKAVAVGSSFRVGIEGGLV